MNNENVIQFPTEVNHEEEQIIANFKPESNLKEFARVVAMIGTFLLVIFLVGFFLGNLLIVP